MRGGEPGSATDPSIAEQIAYYRAVASEYESRALPGWTGRELEIALEAFRPDGRVLELACGPGGLGLAAAAA